MRDNKFACSELIVVAAAVIGMALILLLPIRGEQRLEVDLRDVFSHGDFSIEKLPWFTPLAQAKELGGELKDIGDMTSELTVKNVCVKGVTEKAMARLSFVSISEEERALVTIWLAVPFPDEESYTVFAESFKNHLYQAASVNPELRVWAIDGDAVSVWEPFISISKNEHARWRGARYEDDVISGEWNMEVSAYRYDDKESREFAREETGTETEFLVWFHFTLTPDRRPLS